MASRAEVDAALFYDLPKQHFAHENNSETNVRRLDRILHRWGALRIWSRWSIVRSYSQDCNNWDLLDCLALLWSRHLLLPAMRDDISFSLVMDFSEWQ